MMNVSRMTGFAAALAMSMAGVTTASAQDAAAEFSLELNNAAETSAGDCRLTFVASNGLGQDLGDIAYEVAVFDGSGIVSRILVLELGSLTEGKTKVLQFDLAGQPCSNTSRIIVNAVAACTLADGTVAGDLCLSGLAAGSRGAIQFGI
ncbi:hypothetical protein SAMN04488515_2663 [Cognatiyoonia koreensis]|uniref:Tat pathway signal sequence domain protein n=1 Tax=Cognatiyoonia koreensis TaxID=364200 RepID=A0A1I0RHC8_9RHOB|nr:hypothetical protein [Cognatiyoonia koreensis]SEW40081.1 hypothetical protein SAMN04488515_2663 [Cognatiyoonia koreensis]